MWQEPEVIIGVVYTMNGPGLILQTLYFTFISVS